MTGIDKICEKIIAEAQAECDSIISRARAEAAEITQSYASLAKEESDKIIARGTKNASDREARLSGAASLEARKLHLKTKQQMLDTAFDKALEALRSLPEDEYIMTLASLAAQSAVTGKEEVILNASDRAAYGKQVVNEANRILNAEDGDAPSVVKLGKQLLAKLGGGLTLSEETREISGGVILRQGKMEANATFETLIRLNRDRLSAETAQLLFG